MKRLIDITLKVSLSLDATMSEDDIVTHVRSALPDAFGEELTAVRNPVDIIGVRSLADISLGKPRVPSDPERMNASAPPGPLLRCTPSWRRPGPTRRTHRATFLRTLCTGATGTAMTSTPR